MKKPKNKRNNKRKKSTKRREKNQSRWVDITQYANTVDDLINKTARGYRLFTDVDEIGSTLNEEDAQKVYNAAALLTESHDELKVIRAEMPSKRGVVDMNRYPTYLDLHSRCNDVNDRILMDAVVPLEELTAPILIKAHEAAEAKKAKAEESKVDE